MDSARDMICIVCPVGCNLRVERRGEEVMVTGNSCPRGVPYAKAELLNPVRMVTSSVPVSGGDYRMLSLKTREPVPKARIADVLAQMRRLKLQAPVSVGQVLIEDVCGTGVAVVATRAVKRA